MKLVHAADLHIDSPLRGLAQYEGAPVEEMRQATRVAFENLVTFCVEESVQALLLAGDLFDGDWRDLQTGLWLNAQLRRLREPGIRVFTIRGNHDAASKLTRDVRWPENVHVFEHRNPETVVDEALGLAVHGQSYGKRDVVKDLAAGYPDAVPGCFNVGLLHTALDGREGHDAYAPTSVDVLRQRGYDYWALGHVHAYEVVSEDPWIVFPGNLQGRHARELGPKGAVLLSVSEDGTLESMERVECDVVRWLVLEVDVNACERGDDVVDRVRSELRALESAADGRLAAVRVKLVGSSAAHGELHDRSEHWIREIREAALDLDAPRCWVEKVQVRTSAPRATGLRDDDPFVGALAELMASMAEDPDLLEDRLKSVCGDLLAKLPAQAHSALAGSPERRRELLDAAEQLLFSRMAAEAPE